MDFVKIASKEMLKGSKMLSKHCSICGAPMFEDKEGNEYCPICKGEDKITNISNIDKSTSNNINNHQDILNKKINYLFNKLDDETDINRITEIGIALKTIIELRYKETTNK
jgi:UPF0148 protein